MDAFWQHTLNLFPCTGIVNKTQHGLELLDAELCKYLGREGVEPNTWVFPPKMKMYASYVPPPALEVFRSGQAAVKNLSGATAAQASFQGKAVYESREYAVVRYTFACI